MSLCRFKVDFFVILFLILVLCDVSQSTYPYVVILGTQLSLLSFGCLLVGWGLVPPSSSKLVRIRSLGMVMDALLFHSGWSLIIDFYRPYLEKPGRSPGGVYWGGVLLWLGGVGLLSPFFLSFLLFFFSCSQMELWTGPSYWAQLQMEFRFAGLLSHSCCYLISSWYLRISWCSYSLPDHCHHNSGN